MLAEIEVLPSPTGTEPSGGLAASGHGGRHMSEQQASFGQQLRQLRVRAGLSQEALAERAGLTAAAVASLERGVRRSPYPRTVGALARALELAAEEQALLADSALQRAPSTARRPTVAVTQASLPAWPRHNLPNAVSSLVGRDQEIAQLASVLGGSRLLTLAGAGGIGKTRLALALGAHVADSYPGGVCLVHLAPIADPGLLHQAVASALNIREQPGRTLLATLVDGLAPRHLLVILDNCEHLVLDCAILVDALLRGCPRLSILVTSREPLGLSGEVTWRVPSLRVPSVPEFSPEKLRDFDAVRLFIQRAAAVQPGFRLTAHNAPAVAELCRRVDGIALAIELAAAWLRVLSPEQILARLNDALGLLVGGSRTAPVRQQTLRAAIEWSYGLLDERERLLFQRLGVFAGGWTLEAAEGICAADAIAVGDVLPVLTRLVDKSLVIAEVQEESGQVRYRLLELLRAYSLERAEDAGELSGQHRRHRDWFLSLAERIPPEMLSPPHIAELEAERDNVRAALRWTITARQPGEGLRLATAMWPVWYVRGYYAEGRGWLAELLDMPDIGTPTAGRARAIALAGHLAYCQGEYATAETLLDTAAATAEAVADEQTLAVVLQFQGNLARARGELDCAQELYALACQLNHRLENPLWEAMSLVGQGQAAADQNKHLDAERFATESLTLCRRAGHAWGAARSLWILGRVAAGRRAFDAARQLLQACIDYQQDIGDRQGVVWARLDLAQSALSACDLSLASECLASGLRLAGELGDRLSVARAVEGIATLVTSDRPAEGVRLAASASALRAAIGAPSAFIPRAPLETALDSARRTLGRSAYRTAWASGCSLAIEQVVNEALDVVFRLGAEAGPKPTREALANVLTGREREVAILLTRGLTDRQIAERLVITEGTAGVHVAHILAKLSFHSRAQVAAWMVEHGLEADIVARTRPAQRKPEI
jgi:predicted ATPase/DNA-binding NarL/FixJ family response regulator/transcriptional regulator with XRE-family HTH domain